MPKPSHLFSPVITTSRSSTYECDLNGHKSNSTYFSDLDIARTHLVCHLTKGSFAQRRQRGEPVMYVALAGVTALFRREIKPFACYAVYSRVLCWDRKWLFVVSHFVDPAPPSKGGSPPPPKDGGVKERVVYASCLSKYVFKSGRKTVTPEVVLRESNLLPARPAGCEEPDAGSGASSSGIDTPLAGLRGRLLGEARLEAAVERIVNDDLARAGAETRAASDHDGDGMWPWDKIEAERRRGMEIAKAMLGLDALVDEFREGVASEGGLEAVGPFYAGW